MAGVLTQDAEQPAVDSGQVCGAVIFPDRALVLLKYHVKLPVVAGLDRPEGVHGVSGFFDLGWRAGDEVAHLGGNLAPLWRREELPLGSHPADGRKVGPAGAVFMELPFFS